MPWDVVTPIDNRKAFVKLALREVTSFSELCDHFGVSRKTGYKWLHRFEAEGQKGLRDKPRVPKSIPHKTCQAVEDFIREWRLKKGWGGSKILQKAEKVAPHLDMPSATTIHNIIYRLGLGRKRRRRTRRAHPGKPYTNPKAPNEIWTTDFKGEFKLLTGRYCYPLTVMDEHSRFVLECKALDSTKHDGVYRAFKRVFREYGLPWAIKSDNGSPFASVGLGRLSRLSVWWIKLGIEPILTQPASPQQNAAHERMHRTLKAEATKPPRASRQAQQRRFNEWRDEYNYVRPHDTLGGDYPGEVYEYSQREYPERIPKVEYPDHFEVRRVSANNGFRWNKQYVPASSVLEHEYIGLEPIDDGIWAVYFSWKLLGFLDERVLRIEDDLGRIKRT